MQLFVLPFQHPIEFWGAVLMAGIIIGIAFAAAKTPERRGIRWVRSIAGTFL